MIQAKLSDLRGEQFLGSSDSAIDQLSAREFEVAKLASVGFSNKEIARALEISPHTVSSHLRQTFTKLNVNRRVALAQVLFSETQSPRTLTRGFTA